MMAEELRSVKQKLAGGVDKPEAPSTSSPVDRKRKRIDEGTATSVPLAALEELSIATLKDNKTTVS